MWRIKYSVYWLIFKVLWVVSEPKRRELRERLTRWFGFAKDQLFADKTPVEERDEYIEYVTKYLNKRFNDQFEKLKNDPEFEKFITKGNSVGSINGDRELTSVNLDNVKEFYENIAPQYAKMFYLFNSVTSVQIPDELSGTDEKVANVYGLSMGKTSNGLQLAIKQHPVKLKGINYPFLDFTRFFYSTHILNVENATVNTSYMHYAWGFLSTLFELAPSLPEEDRERAENAFEEQWHCVGLNIIANTIARDSKRGAGNVLIISDKDVKDLKYTMWKFHHRNARAEDTKSYREMFIKEEQYDIPDFEELMFLKYEFTANNMRVFSSSMFNEIKSKTGYTSSDNDDVNAIMMYNGNRNDAATMVGDGPTIMPIGEVCNWIPWKEIDAGEAYEHYSDHFFDKPDTDESIFPITLYKVRDSFTVVDSDPVENLTSEFNSRKRMVKFNMPLLKEEE